MTNLSNMPKLSNRAQKALDVLADGSDAGRRPQEKVNQSFLNGLLLLKKLNLIERATEARFLGRHDGDLFFGLSDGDVCGVDLVTSTVKVAGVVVLRGAA